VFEELWRVLAEECEELGGLDWTWQSADGVMGKSRFEGKKRALLLLPWVTVSGVDG